MCTMYGKKRKITGVLAVQLAATTTPVYTLFTYILINILSKKFKLP